MGALGAEHTDNLNGAAVLLDESLTCFGEDVASRTYSLLHLANVARQSTDYARARALYAKTMADARAAGDRWVLGWTLAHAAHLAFLEDDLPQAAALYREGLVLLVEIEATWGIAECLFGLTCIAGVLGQPHRAARLFGAGQALHQNLGAPAGPETMYPSHLRGLTAARDALGEARFDALAREWRATSLDQVVAHALTNESDEGRPAPVAATTLKAAAPSALTVRECQVAVLITEGLSNREIARTLVITPRTADTHVMNILTKLGLHSRAQVAAWAAQHGLLAADNLENT